MQIKSTNQTLPKYTLTKVVVGLDLVPTAGAVCYIVCECTSGKVFALIHFLTISIEHPVLINTFIKLLY